jgi:hypothetical protein
MYHVLAGGNLIGGISEGLTLSLPFTFIVMTEAVIAIGIMPNGINGVKGC